MIEVLRLGHRLGRDARISTHCGLVARAFGASGITYSGDRDGKMMDSVRAVTGEWGGSFSTGYEKNWEKVVKDFRGTRVHLTMYGIPLENKIVEMRKKRKVLVVVGGEKVPGEIYDMVDFNIAVTNQPHSEIAALGVFLHEYFRGKPGKRFKDARLRVVPQERGKKIYEN